MPTTTVVNYITQPVIERVVERTGGGSGFSTDALTLILGEFRRSLRTEVTTIVGNSIGGSLCAEEISA